MNSLEWKILPCIVSKSPFIQLLREVFHRPVSLISLSKRAQGSSIRSQRILNFYGDHRGILRSHMSMSVRYFSSTPTRSSRPSVAGKPEVQYLCDRGKIDLAYMAFMSAPTLSNASILLKKFLDIGEKKYMNLALHIYGALIKHKVDFDVVFYSILMRLCNQHDPQKVFELFLDMQKLKIKINDLCLENLTFAANKTDNIEMGKHIVDSHLKGFDQFQYEIRPTVINNLLELFSRHKEVKCSHIFFEWMIESKTKPNKSTFILLLRTFIEAGPSALEYGKSVHKRILESPFVSDQEIVSLLARMYTKCDTALEKSGEKEKEETEQSANSQWKSLIDTHNKNKNYEKMLDVYNTMTQEENAYVSPEILVLVLTAAMNLGSQALPQGEKIHQKIIQQQLFSDPKVVGKLIQMYKKCGDPLKSIEIFNVLKSQGKYVNVETFHQIIEACGDLGEKGLEIGKYIHNLLTTYKYGSNVQLNNALISMYDKCGQSIESLRLFDQMRESTSETKPDRFSITYVLRVCANIGPNALQKGKQIHRYVQELGFENNLVIMSVLIQMYDLCGEPKKSVEIYDDMIKNKCKPNEFTFASILKVLGNINGLEKGREIHQDIIHHGFSSNIVALTALIGMYRECGDLKKSIAIFDEIVAKNQPVASTFSSVLSTISKMGPEGLEKGKQVHQMIIQQKLEENSFIKEAIKKMYVRCDPK